MSATVILTQYPVSNTDRHALVERFGDDAEFLIVSNIVHTGYQSLIRQLRLRSYSRLILFSTSKRADVMVPIFRLLAQFIPATERFFLPGVDGEIHRWSYARVLGDAFLLLRSALYGVFSLVSALVYLSFIGLRERIQVDADMAGHKHVLYLRPTFWQGVRAGGALSHGRGVVEGFLEHGYDIDVFAEENFIDLPEGRGSFQAFEFSHPFIAPREINYLGCQRSFVKQLKARFGQTYKGFIYQRVAVASFTGIVMSRFWRVPLVIEYNGNEVWLARNWGSPFLFERIIQFIERSQLAHAHLIVVVSEALKRQLVAEGVEEKRIVVCPNSVNLEQFNANRLSAGEHKRLREENGFDEDDVVFAFVGTFGPWHGASLLAEAIARLNDLSSDELDTSKIKFLLIGDGVEYPTVTAKLRDEIERGQVKALGLVEHESIPDYLSICDVCLAPTVANADGSEFFGSPTKIFEYVAMGKPLIASAVGQVKEIMAGSPLYSQVSGNEAVIPQEYLDAAKGILFDAGDANQLTSSIRLLAKDTRGRKSLSENSLKYVNEGLTWRANVSNVTQSLASALEAVDNKTSRILINGLHSKSGGGVTYLSNMLPIVAKMTNIELHLLLHRSQLEIFSPLPDGVTLHVSDARGTMLGYVIAEQFWLPVLARKISADTVFSVANYGPLAIRNGAILLRNSLDVATVERRIQKLMYWGAIYGATLLSVVCSRKVIAVSKYARDSSLRGIMSPFKRKVRIVPHGIAPVYFEIQRSPATPQFILAVSDIYVQKNLIALVEAFEPLYRVDRSLKLKIAGKPLDASYFSMLQSQVEALGIRDGVEFLGHVQLADLRQLYKTCAVFVFASTVETFGNPLVEAMAAGCPIVCSNAAAMPEVADDAALFVDPHQPREFTNAIERLLGDRELREDLSARARRRGRLYSWEKTAMNTVAILKSQP